MRVKGDMFCPRCEKPVMGRRSSQITRKYTAAFWAMPTFGLSLLAGRSKWFCPDCGGKVRRMRYSDRKRVRS